MIVISDSSVVTGLLSINKLDLLHQLFNEVLISKAVHEELITLQNFGYDISPLKQPWLVVSEIKNKHLVEELIKVVDLGEAESIALSIENRVDYLLIDEKKGRKLATSKGIKVIGLLGILIQAKKSGLIPLLKPEIEKLTSRIEFRLSKNLIDTALKIVGE